MAHAATWFEPSALIGGKSAATAVAGSKRKDAQRATPEREDLDRQVMGHPNFLRGAKDLNPLLMRNDHESGLHAPDPEAAYSGLAPNGPNNGS